MNPNLRTTTAERGFTFGGVVVAALLALCLMTLPGCSNSEDLRRKITGEWINEAGNVTLFFTDSKVVIRNTLAANKTSSKTWKYSGNGKDSLEFSDEGGWNHYNVDFSFNGNDEFVAVYMGDDKLGIAGRFFRVKAKGPPVPVVKAGPLPLDEANSQIKKFEAKKSGLESTLTKANASKQALVKRLGEIGVKSSDDLKNNVPGQRLAEQLVKLNKEIKDLETKINICDLAVLDAQAAVRKLEEDKSAPSEEDLKKLRVRLLELDKDNVKTDAPTPLEIDAAIKNLK